MFLIWGFRTKAAVLGRLLLVCHFCSQPAAQTLTRRTRWFTLFFIPLIPFKKTNVLQCAMCGNAHVITPEDAERFVAQVQAAMPTAAPVGDPDMAHEALPAAE